MRANVSALFGVVKRMSITFAWKCKCAVTYAKHARVLKFWKKCCEVRLKLFVWHVFQIKCPWAKFGKILSVFCWQWIHESNIFAPPATLATCCQEVKVWKHFDRETPFEIGQKCKICECLCSIDVILNFLSTHFVVESWYEVCFECHTASRNVICECVFYWMRIFQTFSGGALCLRFVFKTNVSSGLCHMS